MPALLVIYGLLSSMPFMYYVITIGAYVILFAAAELTVYLVCKAFEKKYTPIIEKKLGKLANRFAKQQ